MKCPSNLSKLLLITLISCALTTNLIVLFFPSGFISLIQIMHVRNTGGWARFYHMRELATNKDRNIAKPNRDTLYSSAVVDLSNGPVVVYTPAYDKYWNVQLVDKQSDVFGYIGSRTIGARTIGSRVIGSRAKGTGHETTTLIVPPGFTGDTANLPTIEAASKKIWVVYRVHVTSPEDMTTAHKAQDQVTLTPLSQYRIKE